MRWITRLGQSLQRKLGLDAEWLGQEEARLRREIAESKARQARLKERQLRGGRDDE
jgi:hypothetical protein